MESNYKNLLTSILASNKNLLLFVDQNYQIIEHYGNLEPCINSTDLTNKELFSILPDNICEELQQTIESVTTNSLTKHYNFALKENSKVSYFKVYLKLEKNLFLLLFSEITTYKELENRLNQNHKLEIIGSLVSGIAHEINTPLQYIQSNLSFIKDQLENLDEVNKNSFMSSETNSAIQDTIEGVGQINEIISSLRHFSYSGNEKGAEVELKIIIEKVLNVSKNEWKNVCKIDVDVASNVTTIYAPVGKIEQCLLNLVINSAHAIKEKNFSDPVQGLIKIKANATEKMLTIDIEDNGKGIPENLQNRIFETFFTTKDISQGTGQGLSIVKNIVEDSLNGEISFSSQEGQGSCFTLKLPKFH